MLERILAFVKGKLRLPQQNSNSNELIMLILGSSLNQKQKQITTCRIDGDYILGVGPW